MIGGIVLLLTVGSVLSSDLQQLLNRHYRVSIAIHLVRKLQRGIITLFCYDKARDQSQQSALQGNSDNWQQSSNTTICRCISLQTRVMYD